MRARLRGGTHVSVRLSTGKTITLSVEASDSLDTMKAKIQDVGNVVAKDLFVWLGGCDVCWLDSQVARDFNIFCEFFMISDCINKKRIH